MFRRPQQIEGRLVILGDDVEIGSAGDGGLRCGCGAGPVVAGNNSAVIESAWRDAGFDRSGGAAQSECDTINIRWSGRIQVINYSADGITADDAGAFFHASTAAVGNGTLCA